MDALYVNVPDARESSSDGANLPGMAVAVAEVSEGTGQEMHAIEIPADGVMVELSSEDRLPWEGVLGLEGAPTSDNRLLIPGEIDERDLPLPLMVQTTTAEGHDGSENAGRIESISHIPIGDFERVEEYGIDPSELPDNTVVIWAEGTFDQSEYADEAQRMLENGAGISLDVPRTRVAAFDPQTLEEIDLSEMDPLEALLGDYVQGFGGKIAGATVVAIPAFESAKIGLKPEEPSMLVASGSDDNEVWHFTSNFGINVIRSRALVAAAAPLKPPKEWFEDPKLRQLTPLTITKEGQVYGHLADWNGCHTGFSNVCIRPFRSKTNFAFFNVGEIETAGGECVPCGKIMFSRNGVGHAPLDPRLSISDIHKHYDDGTHVGAFVRAGSDRYGIWLAGALRSDLNDLEVQHLRTHPPSGDWRPYKSGSELVAAFSVPVPGYPIRRALVASANGGLSLISAPLELDDATYRARYRRRTILSRRLKEALGMEKSQTEVTIERLRTKAAEEIASEEVEELALDHGQAENWANDVVEAGQKLVSHEQMAQQEYGDGAQVVDGHGGMGEGGPTLEHNADETSEELSQEDPLSARIEKAIGLLALATKEQRTASYRKGFELGILSEEKVAELESLAGWVLTTTFRSDGGK
jgi:hypothetical protein